LGQKLHPVFLAELRFALWWGKLKIRKITYVSRSAA
jgi:hypothetical protein